MEKPFTIVVILFLSFSDVHSSEVSVSVVSGVHVKQLNNALVYEASIPVNFRLALPNFIDQKLTSTITCTNKGYMCSLAEYVNNTYNAYLENAINEHPFLGKEPIEIRAPRGLINAAGYFYKYLY